MNPVPTFVKDRCYVASRETLRRRYMRRQNLRSKTGIKSSPIKDNSVPWSERPPQSIDDILRISDQIDQHCEELRRTIVKHALKSLIRLEASIKGLSLHQALFQS